MNVYKSIMKGLKETLEYEKGKGKARVLIVPDKNNMRRKKRPK